MSHSPITNRWGKVKSVKLDVEEIIVYRGRHGAGYCHHAELVAHNGVLYATWSLGQTNEDDVGQRMVLATSADGGRTWSEPRDVSGVLPGKIADGVVTNGGILAVDDAMVAYYGYYEFVADGMIDGHRKPERQAIHTGAKTFAAISRDGGLTWSQPQMIVDRFVPNLGPVATASGRLIMPGNLTYPFTDDPSGLTGWRTASLPRIPADLSDEVWDFPRGNSARGDAWMICEGSFYQCDDGVLNMMLRTGKPGLVVSHSCDDGKTWSEPLLTDYSDCGSKVHFGRLPDGRFFGLSTPNPSTDPMHRRTPLVLAISADGMVFDRHFILGDHPNTGPRTPGLHKGGQYGYPYLHIDGTTIYVIYSIQKEDIAVIAFDLSQIR